ncbi:hypothetical protein ETK61_01355 [Bacillus subtilis]|nr:hypothetical protein CLD04_01650 [Bacillus subtilis]NOV08606.1 hypothetical protein [Bacillus sp. seq1]QBJ80847.1 hypothetical protein DL538_01715 [Bacillus subtilis subsp. subtilis]MBE0188638.1 hypothetical protein [Bacillus subtilis]QAW35441.1 hypothetical protein ETK61_01355 [Bacillus subtilis]
MLSINNYPPLLFVLDVWRASFPEKQKEPENTPCQKGLDSWLSSSPSKLLTYNDSAFLNYHSPERM